MYLSLHAFKAVHDTCKACRINKDGGLFFYNMTAVRGGGLNKEQKDNREHAQLFYILANFKKFQSNFGVFLLQNRIRQTKNITTSVSSKELSDRMKYEPMTWVFVCLKAKAGRLTKGEDDLEEEVQTLHFNTADLLTDHFPKETLTSLY